MTLGRSTISLDSVNSRRRLWITQIERESKAKPASFVMKEAGFDVVLIRQAVIRLLQEPCE